MFWRAIEVEHGAPYFLRRFAAAGSQSRHAGPSDPIIRTARMLYPCMPSPLITKAGKTGSTRRLFAPFFYEVAGE